MAATSRLKQIVEKGGNLELTEQLSSSLLVELVTLAKQTGSHITLVDAHVSPSLLDEILAIAPKQITVKTS